MEQETYTKKTYGHCKCSPLDVIVRFENSNLSVFNWKHRYTFLNDTEKTCNIFRCANCKKIIHDNFVVEKQTEMEKQQKIAYKISTPLGHVAHCIEKYGIEMAIEEYRCKSVNNKESKFWNDCLKIAEFSYNI